MHVAGNAEILKRGDGTQRRTGAAEPPLGYEAETLVATQLIGRRGRIRLVFMKDDQEEWEEHAVEVYAVEGCGYKVALQFTRAGVVSRRVMRADVAKRLLPPPSFVMGVPFVSALALQIFNNLPLTASAEDGRVSCEEVVQLAAGLSMPVPPIGFNEYSAQQAGARAAMVFYDHLNRYLESNTVMP